MTNFTLVPSRYMQIPDLLKARFPGFASSEPYLLHNGVVDDLPGVILASFADYLMALGDTPKEDDERREAFGMIDDMLAWSDSETETSIRDEFFWVLDSKPRSLPRALSMMPPSVRLAFETWRAEPY